MIKGIMSNTRIVPVRNQNRAKLVTKRADGSLDVEQGDGRKFTLPASEPEMQAFLVWTMLNSECTESH